MRRPNQKRLIQNNFLWLIDLVKRNLLKISCCGYTTSPSLTQTFINQCFVRQKMTAFNRRKREKKFHKDQLFCHEDAKKSCPQ